MSSLLPSDPANMAVAILILSGPRQREEVALERAEFRVGMEAGCDVFLGCRALRLPRAAWRRFAGKTMAGTSVRPAATH